MLIRALTWLVVVVVAAAGVPDGATTLAAGAGGRAPSAVAPWQIAFLDERRGGTVVALWTSPGSIRTFDARGATAIAWSPTGRRLAYLSGGNLHVRPLGRLGQRFPSRCSWHLSFSPFGTRLICGGDSGFEGGQPAVYFVDLTTGSEHFLLGGPSDQPGFYPEHPAWASDGTIALQTWSPGGIVDFYRLRRGARKLARTRERAPIFFCDNYDAPYLHSLSWSPDAGQLAATLGGCSLPTRSEIWVASRNGTNARRLVRNGAHPSWSPDGRWIAFERMSRGGSDILAVDVRSGQLRKLATSRRKEAYPAWRPR